MASLDKLDTYEDLTPIKDDDVVNDLLDVVHGNRGTCRIIWRTHENDLDRFINRRDDIVCRKLKVVRPAKRDIDDCCSL